MQAKRRLATTSRACPLVVPNALYAQCFTTTAKIKPKKGETLVCKKLLSDRTKYLSRKGLLGHDSKSASIFG